MSIFFQQDLNGSTRLGIWKIEEEEDFFLRKVPLQRDITHPHKRLQHLAGRYLLKYLYPDFPTELIRIADTRKPFLEDEAYHFSISHCGNFAAVLVSKDCRVGIDIEMTSEKVLRILHKFLHQEEHMLLGRGTGEENFIPTLLWSAKEAMFKWWGRGEVDFSEMLRLSDMQTLSGKMQGKFIRGDLRVSFPVYYKTFPGMVMAWVMTKAIGC
ncbi:MAG: 4'-phosphopantetheinyl transferase family protein [Flavisolibacter sp.]